MRGNEYGKSGHLSIFTLLEQLMMLLKANFFLFMASLLHLFKGTGSIQGLTAQIFFKWMHCSTMPVMKFPLWA